MFKDNLLADKGWGFIYHFQLLHIKYFLLSVSLSMCFVSSDIIMYAQYKLEALSFVMTSVVLVSCLHIYSNITCHSAHAIRYYGWCRLKFGFSLYSFILSLQLHLGIRNTVDRDSWSINHPSLRTQPEGEGYLWTINSCLLHSDWSSCYW